MKVDLEAEDDDAPIKRITIKLPRQVVRTLSGVAKRHHRSLQGEVADVLERHAEGHARAARQVSVATERPS